MDLFNKEKVAKLRRELELERSNFKTVIEKVSKVQDLVDRLMAATPHDFWRGNYTPILGQDFSIAARLERYVRIVETEKLARDVKAINCQESGRKRKIKA